VVWATVQDSLPPLKEVVMKELEGMYRWNRIT
jgi:hypothetical protein